MPDGQAPPPPDAITLGAAAIYPPARYGTDEQHCRTLATIVLAAAAPVLRAEGAKNERQRIRERAAPLWVQRGQVKTYEVSADLLDGDTDAN